MINFKLLINQNKTILSNFSYLALLEIFVLIAPLITYPYLVKVLGLDLYGWVVTGQITASYASILIDFGFRRVSAKHIATVRENIFLLSKVVSSVIVLRAVLWVIAFILYMTIIWIIPTYKERWLLFLFSYGMTFSSMLLPDFYFQGIEQMKYISFVNITTRAIFIAATFFIITTPNDYVFVPLLWSLGYIIGGAYSLYIVFGRHKIHFIFPNISDIKFHLAETAPIFFSDLMINIKDKFNYSLLGAFLGMRDVAIYDIGSKIVSLLAKPTAIFCQVIFPRVSRRPNVATTKKIMGTLLILSIIIVAIVYLFLPQIVSFFIHEKIDLLPLRLFLIVPILTGLSFYIPSAVFVAFGYNKYVLYSTIFSSVCYAVMLAIMWSLGLLTSITSFVILTVLSYFVETLFRLYLSHNIFIRHC